jgi:hypothetical protein
MPQNKLLYIGLLVVAASALIWVGAWLTARIEFAVPYAIGVGALMIIAGLVMEAKKKKAAAAGENPPQTPS